MQPGLGNKQSEWLHFFLSVGCFSLSAQWGTGQHLAGKHSFAWYPGRFHLLVLCLPAWPKAVVIRAAEAM